jgi:DNA-directed RNA polymerase subunit RPC12/RpoP
MREKQKVGFDRAIECIKVNSDISSWMCKGCGQKNLLVVGYNEITTCTNCNQMVMIKRR